MEMASQSIVIESDMAYPILFIPKNCTNLETYCELLDNVYIDVTITSPDIDGNNTKIYSGCCNVKLVDSYDDSSNPAESSDSCSGPDIDEMPVVFSDSTPLCPYNKSQVWIDPTRSPYVYNHYDPSSQEQYSVCDSGGLITVKHNTYITQNVYNCTESNNVKYKEHQRSPVKDFERKHYNNQLEADATAPEAMKSLYYDEDEFECGVFLAQLPEEIMSEKHTRAKVDWEAPPSEENSALKQLMSSDMKSSSKHRKTILYLGEDSQSGETIQNISYDDPTVSCVDLDADDEDDTDRRPSRLKKKYQCDKCKQVFKQMSSFWRHMVGRQARAVAPRSQVCFRCNTCGKSLKNQQKFEQHCLGHGDPDVECSICNKVFASKFSLRVHARSHTRPPRARSPAPPPPGSLYVCRDENCSYLKKCTDVSSREHWHEMEGSEFDDPGAPEAPGEGPGKDSGVSEMDLKTEMEQLDEDFRASRQLTRELSSSEDFSLSTLSAPPSTPPTTSPVPSSSLSSSLSPSLSPVLSPSLSPQEAEVERVRAADSVLASVMSSKVFLLSSKQARRHRRACEVCLKTFDRVDDLKRHLIEHVIRSTLAKCPVSRSGNLKITCEVCKAQKFTRVDKYKVHLREHAQLTIYRCTFCDKCFSDSSNFSKHKKIHGTAYFQCDLCHRKFNSKRMLSLHLEQHRTAAPARCADCCKVFHFQSALNKHVRAAHRPEPKYRCTVCRDKFHTPKDKWAHEWEAHNIRKMIMDCRICGNQFRKYSELKRHCHDDHGVDIPRSRWLARQYSTDDE